MTKRAEPVGFIRCRTCKDIAEVVPFAKGEGYFTRCPCGTDQRRGKSRQDYLANNMVDTREQLEQAAEPEPAKKKQAASDPEGAPTSDKKPDGTTQASGKWWLAIPGVAAGLLILKFLRQ